MNYQSMTTTPSYALGNRKINLLDLAPELIIHICESTDDWRTIFTVKKVCRVLNQIMDDRAIWVHLVCISMRSNGARLDRPISTYTKEELAGMFMRWTKVERKWSVGSDKIELNIRPISLPRPYSPATLISSPGGRWLLIFADDLSAVCFDLHSDHSDTPMPLIPAHHPLENGGCPFRVSQIDVNEQSLKLSFRVALSFVTSATRPTAGPSCTEIWEINSMDDGASLSAKCVSSFRFDVHWGLLSIRALRGDFILLTIPRYMFFADALDESELCLVNWKDASFRVLVIRDSSSAVFGAAILKDDIILLSTQSGVRLVHCSATPLIPISDCRNYLGTTLLTPLPDTAYVTISPTEYSFMSPLHSDDLHQKVFLSNRKGNLATVVFSNCGASVDIVESQPEDQGWRGARALVFGHSSLMYTMHDDDREDHQLYVVPNALRAIESGPRPTNVMLGRYDTLRLLDDSMGRAFGWDTRGSTLWILEMEVA